MFKLMLAAAVLTAPSAFADDFNAQKASSAWYTAHSVCRGNVEEGSPTPDEACRMREILTVVLMMHDYCWDNPEQEWIRCLPKP